jgi:hypothetical protein
VRLQEEELDDCKFAAEPELSGLLADTYAPRVRAALLALSAGCARYVPDVS